MNIFSWIFNRKKLIGYSERIPFEVWSPLMRAFSSSHMATYEEGIYFLYQGTRNPKRSYTLKSESGCQCTNADLDIWVETAFLPVDSKINITYV